MSAIFGIFNKAGQTIDERSMATMSDRLKHHATNGTGNYTQEGIFLGHHLFAVNKRQALDKQPVEWQGLVITASARIDNRDELAKLLGMSNAPVLTDSLIILHAFRKWGKECPSHFEGEFAFVIWNKIEKTIFGACDHVATRTFFFYDSAELFVFATEIKAVLAAKPAPHEFDEEELITIVTRDYRSNTFVKGITALQSGHSLFIARTGSVEIKRYWTYAIYGKYSFTTASEWGECLRELTRTFLLNKIGDRPVGVLLSGGLDSSLVTAIAAELLMEQNRPLYSFSGALPPGHFGQGLDEQHQQDMVQRSIPNLIHHTVWQEPGIGPFTDIDRAIHETDQVPNMYHYLDTALYGAAADKGVGTLLNGFMGDTFISSAGYDSLYRLLAGKRFADSWRFANAISINYDLSLYSILRSDVLRHTTLWRFARSAKNAVLSNKFLTVGFSPTLNKKMDERNAACFFKSGNCLNDKIAVVNSGIWGRIANLYQYRSPYFRFEKGTPFMDRKLLEFFTDVPADVFISRGFRRGLIREAMDGLLPVEITWRKDKGSYTPDFVARVVAERQQIDEILGSQENQRFFSIADKQTILDTVSFFQRNPMTKLSRDRSVPIIALTGVCFLKNVTDKFKILFGK